jgi:copper chaperone CopZ
MAEVSYHVHDIHCEACESSIRKALAPVSGVETVSVDLNHKRVTVRFDDGATDVLAIKERIEGAGFEVG